MHATVYLPCGGEIEIDINAIVRHWLAMICMTLGAVDIVENGVSRLWVTSNDVLALAAAQVVSDLFANGSSNGLERPPDPESSSWSAQAAMSAACSDSPLGVQSNECESPWRDR